MSAGIDFALFFATHAVPALPALRATFRYKARLCCFFIVGYSAIGLYCVRLVPVGIGGHWRCARLVSLQNCVYPRSPLWRTYKCNCVMRGLERSLCLVL